MSESSVYVSETRGPVTSSGEGVNVGLELSEAWAGIGRNGCGAWGFEHPAMTAINTPAAASK